ncbi:hypothetical protein NEUTE2DRAFT_123810 [Neurospora tetrasperma FGSC 2509]|nr:hypothetical protein NEUTE2DRAFT_123810 [Neurospora tetrasperma FGSC 2509]
MAISVYRTRGDIEEFLTYVQAVMRNAAIWNGNIVVGDIVVSDEMKTNIVSMKHDCSEEENLRMHWQNRIAFSIIVGMVAGAFAFALTYQCFHDYQRRRTLPRGADESPPAEV